MKEQDQHILLFAAAYPQDLVPVAELLERHQIDFLVEGDNTAFNPNMTFAHDNEQFKLLVPIELHADAMALLVEHGILASTDPYHGLRLMLSDYTNDELLELIVDAGRQPEDQVFMARKLLEERGETVSEGEIEAMKTELAATERKPHNIGILGKVVFLLGCIFVTPLALAAAAAVALLSGTDTNGRSYWLFSKKDRNFFGYLGLIFAFIYLCISLVSARFEMNSWEYFPYKW
jgi:hypothetical protein